MKAEDLNGKPFKGLVNVAQLLKQPTGSSCSYRADEIVDEQAKYPVQGKITLTHSGQGILIRAELTVKVELTCSRCLNEFLYPVSFSIEEEMPPTINVSSGLPLSKEPSAFTVDSNNMLDLGEIIRQYTLLNLPMKPLCQPDCAGIKEVSSHGSA